MKNIKKITTFAVLVWGASIAQPSMFSRFAKPFKNMAQNFADYKIYKFHLHEAKSETKTSRKLNDVCKSLLENEPAALDFLTYQNNLIKACRTKIKKDSRDKKFLGLLTTLFGASTAYLYMQKNNKPQTQRITTISNSLPGESETEYEAWANQGYAKEEIDTKLQALKEALENERAINKTLKAKAAQREVEAAKAKAAEAGRKANHRIEVAPGIFVPEDQADKARTIIAEQRENEFVPLSNGMLVKRRDAARAQQIIDECNPRNKLK